MRLLIMIVLFIVLDVVSKVLIVLRLLQVTDYLMILVNGILWFLM